MFHCVHIPLYLSFIDGHLGCFHILAIVNNAAVNIGVHISFRVSVSFSLDKYPEVELLDCMVVFLKKFFEDPSYCFP